MLTRCRVSRSVADEFRPFAWLAGRLPVDGYVDSGFIGEHSIVPAILLSQPAVVNSARTALPAPVARPAVALRWYAARLLPILRSHRPNCRRRRPGGRHRHLRRPGNGSL